MRHDAAWHGRLLPVLAGALAVGLMILLACGESADSHRPPTTPRVDPDLAEAVRAFENVVGHSNELEQVLLTRLSRSELDRMNEVLRTVVNNPEQLTEGLRMEFWTLLAKLGPLDAEAVVRLKRSSKDLALSANVT